MQMWLIGSAVADILIAGAMTYLLLNTVEPGTHHIVKRVVRLIVETNSLTASVAIVGAVPFAFSKSLYFLCPTSILPELYANTLLLVLNNRATPSRTAPQRAPPSSNKISSVSDGTTAHTQSPGLPGRRAHEDDVSPLGSYRPTSFKKRPSMSLDNTPSPRGMPLSPPRSGMSLGSQATNANNHPTVDFDRRDFGFNETLGGCNFDTRLVALLNNRATPNRTAPQRAPPSSNNISSVSDGTAAHTLTRSLPRSLYDYSAPEDVPMRTMSPPLGSNRRTSVEKRPSMSLDDTPVPRGIPSPPPRSGISLASHATNANNYPTVGSRPSRF
ncbi:hypothetical protein C8J57DRAFT_1577653 [Mycena rebaudengoi]|nr:hypothetical protein C8J57DRAFT_1577653 [Mycena rebaudengoi]